MSPIIYIIAGPNGAGKTTFARQFLPLYADLKTFVNSDLIAQGLSPFLPEAAAFQAGRLVLQQIAHYIHRGEDFGFESTLSGRSHLGLIQRARRRGYQVHIFYIWVPDVELSLARIRMRVSQGGHDVPQDSVIRRHSRSIRNFLLYYRPLADSWAIFDNSGAAFREVAYQEEGQTRIIDAGLFDTLMEHFGKP